MPRVATAMPSTARTHRLEPVPLARSRAA
jgi:hypothetical protein